MKPLFSVIIPTYNRERFLKKAVDSVLRQTLESFELIVIDDGSGDGTKDLIGSYGDRRLKYFHQDNCGAACARNRGLDEASGEWVAFLDSDDWWLPEKLERTQRYMQSYPSIKIFHTEEVWYKDGKRHNPKTKHKKPGGWVYANALPLCCISISTAVVHKSVFERTGRFDETFEVCEDYDFWLRATNQFEVKLIPEYLTEKDGGRPDQLSMSVWGLDRFRIKALDKILSGGRLSEEHYRLTLDELKNKCRIFIQGALKRNKDTKEFRDILEKYQIKVLDVSGASGFRN